MTEERYFGGFPEYWPLVKMRVLHAMFGHPESMIRKNYSINIVTGTEGRATGYGYCKCGAVIRLPREEEKT